MPLPTGAWRVFERKVAKMLGTVRTPLSGMMSGHHTSSDTLHKEIYVECKWLKGRRDAGTAVLNLWDDTVKKAKNEGKIPLLAMHRRGSRVEFGALPLPIAIEALKLYLAKKEEAIAALDELKKAVTGEELP